MYFGGIGWCESDSHSLCHPCPPLFRLSNYRSLQEERLQNQYRRQCVLSLMWYGHVKSLQHVGAVTVELISADEEMMQKAHRGEEGGGIDEEEELDEPEQKEEEQQDEEERRHQSPPQQQEPQDNQQEAAQSAEATQERHQESQEGIEGEEGEGGTAASPPPAASGEDQKKEQETLPHIVSPGRTEGSTETPSYRWQCPCPICAIMLAQGRILWLLQLDAMYIRNRSNKGDHTLTAADVEDLEMRNVLLPHDVVTELEAQASDLIANKENFVKQDTLCTSTRQGNPLLID